MSTIDDLESINERLGDWIINTVPGPGNAQGMQDMQQAMSLHNQLDQLLARLQLADLQAQAAKLGAILNRQGTQLTSISAKINGTANTIQDAESVISYAAQAVAAAASIASFL
jgi:hypothetical protein